MIYVSGRIDQTRLDHYKSQFLQAKEYLEKDVQVYEDRSVVTLWDDLDAMRYHLQDLSKFKMNEELELRVARVMACEKLYLLIGWEYDDMCRLEHTYAKAYGKRIIYSRKF